MNAWIVVVARNNLSLLQQAVRSFQAQICEPKARVLVVNNGSCDATASWLHAHRELTSIHHYPQKGVAHAWNSALRYLFSLGGSHAVDRVLVCNSDVVLRPDTWRWLAAERAPFVTAVGSRDRKSIDQQIKSEPRELMQIGESFEYVDRQVSFYPEPRADAKRPHPDFSCFMISRGCWERVGPFDEHFAGAFCEDSDYHCRMHQAGIHAYSIDLPFWHVGGGSATIKLANETERKEIAKQAMRNREYFLKKWGFPVPSRENEGREYYGFFQVSPPEEAAR